MLLHIKLLSLLIISVYTFINAIMHKKWVKRVIICQFQHIINMHRNFQHALQHALQFSTCVEIFNSFSTCFEHISNLRNICTQIVTELIQKSM